MFRIFVYRSISYTENTWGTNLPRGLRKVVNLSTYNTHIYIIYVSLGRQCPNLVFHAKSFLQLSLKKCSFSPGSFEV